MYCTRFLYQVLQMAETKRMRETNQVFHATQMVQVNLGIHMMSVIYMVGITITVQ